MTKHTALLGKEAKSVISGFTGLITARADYLTGCVQYCLKPPVDKDGKERNAEWFDVDAIEIIGEGVRDRFPSIAGAPDDDREGHGPKRTQTPALPLGGPQQDQPPT